MIVELAQDKHGSVYFYEIYRISLSEVASLRYADNLFVCFFFFNQNAAITHRLPWKSVLGQTF
jgi:hypothetical protein